MRHEPSIARPLAAYMALACENIGDHLCHFDCSILCYEVTFEALCEAAAAGSAVQCARKLNAMRRIINNGVSELLHD